MNNKITIADLFELKQKKKKLSMVSCYDFLTAKLAAEEGVQSILVGDSGVQFMLGYDSTLPATMDYMITITKAVNRAAPKVYLIADMPFLSYQTGISEALKNAGRFVTEAGADMVKIEATSAYLDVIKAVSNAGMAVMAHIGIRPQQIGKKGRFKAEGTTAEMAADLVSLADKMVYEGASALLLEGTAAEVAKMITERVEVPVISCGSGPDCDGQVLVAPDILGLTEGASPKFAKSYENLAEKTKAAFKAYSDEVQTGEYPDKSHSYHMKKGEMEKLKEFFKKDS